MVQALSAGSLFANRFEIERAAGNGGMGTVFRARDRYSGELVALKLVHAGSDGADEPERFLREAQLLFELRHPGIVAHIAHGQTPQGERFLAMEWLDGEDLGQRLLRGPLALRESLLLLTKVAEALVLAHRSGIIHRDLKPTNLFLVNGDVAQVKILDFGIARRMAAPHAMTKTGIVIGTPEYMAPEQARGVRNLTPAADLFSLGCVFYECLTGLPPFVADHIAAVLVHILFEEPVPLAERRPGVPEAVVALLARMLTKDPAKRLADAGQILAALATIHVGPELALSPTLAITATAAPPRPDGEQVLLSLVMACHPPADDAAQDQSANASSELERRAALLLSLRARGAQADVLLGGALAVRIPPMGSAKDQAMQAVRAALLIQEDWPAARIAVVTGRGRLTQGLTTGEAIGRAWNLLSRPVSISQLPTEPSAPTIWLDDVSAGLLEKRFALKPVAGGGFALGSERMDVDQAQLLLGRPTPCVGRDRELSTLDAIVNECRDEQVARGVLVLAPPGMGKSRLWHELLRRLESRGESVYKLVGRGDPMKAKASYGLLGEALRRHFGIAEKQSPSQQQTHLRKWVDANLPKAQAVRVTEFLGELCGVHFPDSDSVQLRTARQDSRIMGDQVEQAWLDALRAMAEKSTVLLILEDLHWADSLTMKLVHAALRELPEHPLMILLLARPEIQELYPKLGAVQQMPLNPLPQKASERLVRLVLGAEASAATVAQIIEQSSGNPLYLEELIRARMERNSGDIPGTVLAMLQARISRLSARARPTLRAASVFGQTFTKQGVQCLLTATHSADAINAELELEGLVREEIVEPKRERRGTLSGEYAFRHALVRDAAYALVSDEEATIWHAAAGNFLAQAGVRELVVLADHFRLGRELLQAVGYYVTAAEQSYDAGDMEAALSSSCHGLACGASGVEKGTLLGIQALIYMWRGQFAQSLEPSRQALPLLAPGSKPWCRVFEALFPATGLISPADLLPLLAQFIAVQPQREARGIYINAATWVTGLLAVSGQKAASAQVLHRLNGISAELMDPDLNVRAHVLAAQANFFRHIQNLPYQLFVASRESARAFRVAGNRPIEMIMGAHEGKALLDLGQWADARAVLAATLAQAEQIQSETPLGYSRAYMARMLALSEVPADWTQAEEHARKLRSIQNQAMLAQAELALARVHYNRGNFADAESEVRKAFTRLRGFPVYRPEVVALWSRILTAQGNVTAALQICVEETAQIEALELQGSGLIELYSALAAAYLGCADPDSARRIVARALPILRRRAADIPDGVMRATYLQAVPENAYLVKLAAQWGSELATA